MVSKATMTSSMISRVDIKALWLSLMICGKKVFSLLARTFEASLETTLLRVMGLYYVILVGVLTLGIRTMCVSLNYGGMIPRLRKSNTFLLTQLLTMDQ